MSRTHWIILCAVLIGVGVIIFLAKSSVTDEQPHDLVRDNEQSAAPPQKVLRQAVADAVVPLSGSAPTKDTYRTIELGDIRQGCFRQDCIPSVDTPTFVPAVELRPVLPPDSLGIRLDYSGASRFYPFPMLETHELVNDVVAGDPLLISYCPLCGTGVVFDRTLDGEAVEFGVSGMLWNSNLLMYNRAADIADRNLWSQVLGEAVVGERAGERLTIIPSDIMRFGDWLEQNPEGETLTTGRPADPYRGEYYRVASQFAPNFDEVSSELAPDAYVYGIEVAGIPLAITEAVVADPNASLQFAGSAVAFTVSETGAVVFTIDGITTSDIEGFWFSFKAAHPEAVVWDDATISEL